MSRPLKKCGNKNTQRKIRNNINGIINGIIVPIKIFLIKKKSVLTKLGNKIKTAYKPLHNGPPISIYTIISMYTEIHLTVERLTFAEWRKTLMVTCQKFLLVCSCIQNPTKLLFCQKCPKGIRKTRNISLCFRY